MTTLWIVFWMILALALVPLQFFIAAPYGRHTRRGWGPLMNARAGWLIMEAVAPIAFATYLFNGSSNPVTVFLSLCFLAHYAHRSLIFPFRMRASRKSMPVVIVLMAVIFNLINGGINGYFLANNPEYYVPVDQHIFRLILGGLIFGLGATINIYHDNLLLKLRQKGDSDYKIPYGGLFRWVSCPNHFGEIVEWAGFAVMCWNLPALAFFIWTASNLVPRAWHHHRWYHQHFEDYPQNRKSVFPLLF